MRNTDSQQSSKSKGSAVIDSDPEAKVVATSAASPLTTAASASAASASAASASAATVSAKSLAPQSVAAESQAAKPLAATAHLLTGKRSLFFLAAILLLVAWCYAPAIINAFHGDDFLHVHWLTRAGVNNETKLLLDNFLGPWLGAGSVKFYRPLISVTLWLDYRLWGFNAAGFHATNVLFHMASVFCVFFIGQRLALLAGYKQETARTIGIFASALWGVYPLGAEAISWITGRVDATVTAFSMGSLLTYLQWRENNKWSTLALSISLFILALLCKEMAIVLPALFAFIDVLFSDGTWRGRFRSAPFWLVLGGYFAVRQLTMGTMIGAYDDSLGLDPKFLWKRFKGGMPFLFTPFNQTVFNRGDLIVKVWLGLLASSAVLGVAQLVSTRGKVWRLYAFCLGWFALALLPVYKVFDIAPNLESSRYAYLATLPVCLLVATMVAPLWRNRLRSIVQCAVFAALVGIAAYTLHAHNEIWNKAGNISNRIRDQIYAMTSKLPPNPTVVIAGAPDNVQGAYVMRNALPGMVTPPFFPIKIASALTVDKYCPIWPFAAVRDFWAKADNVAVARWDEPTQNLVRVKLTPSATGERILPLKNIDVGGGKATATAKGLQIDAAQKYTILDMHNLNEKCTAFDFVQVTIDGCSDNLEPSTMVYVNDLHPNAWPTPSSSVRPCAVFKEGAQKQRMIFSLRQHPEWTLGGKCTELVFGIPAAGYTIESIKGMNIDKMIPQMILPPHARGSAFVHLAEKNIEISVPGLKSDERLMLEVSPRFGYFEKQYSAQPETKSIVTLFEPGKPVSVNKSPYTPGMYQARVRITDAQGKPRGLASDHVMMIVP